MEFNEVLALFSEREFVASSIIVFFFFRNTAKVH